MAAYRSAKLIDVDGDQLAGLLSFVAQDGRSGIEGEQATEAATAATDPRNGRRCTISIRLCGRVRAVSRMSIRGSGLWVVDLAIAASQPSPGETTSIATTASRLLKKSDAAHLG